MFMGFITLLVSAMLLQSGAGGFPAMAGNVAFLMKDVVLLAVSIYLLKQDVERASLAEIGTPDREWRVIGPRAA